MSLFYSFIYLSFSIFLLFYSISLFLISFPWFSLISILFILFLFLSPVSARDLTVSQSFSQSSLSLSLFLRLSLRLSLSLSFFSLHFSFCLQFLSVSPSSLNVMMVARVPSQNFQFVFSTIEKIQIDRKVSFVAAT